MILLRSPSIPHAVFVVLGMSLALLTLAPAPVLAIPAPEDLVTQTVAARGGRYAGPCSGTHPHTDTGAYCFRAIANQGARRAYLVGQSFSEFAWWVFVERTAAGWQLVETAPLDFTDTRGIVPWPR